MLHLRNLAVLILVAATFAQDDYYDEEPQPPRARPAPARIQPGYSGPAAPRPTPIAILKQINRHNEDGSYTYGYESADGTFKIETKLPTGEVKGKYGYVDDTGKVRVVEYGATKYGFDPSGEGITVPPPTLVDESREQEQEEDLYEQRPARPLPQVPIRRPQAVRPRPQQQIEVEEYSPPQQFEPAAEPPRSAPAQSSFEFDFGPQTQARPAPAPRYSPAPAPRPVQVPGAQPSPLDDFGPAARPAPRVTYAQPVPAPARPAPVDFDIPARPAPRFSQAPRPVYQPRPAPSAPGGRAGGILDQLSKDYALPSGGAAPLHDISFGYY
ncbi:unnamed protein product [Phyllotreta striolata]|uniref:Uncharacterized protein n=1 Tax=Phyllotreta striolata TaxID=444603 RepID=A0A9N9TW45_PHYSR|nr:unnamed protein product [Phyllotreta striolata]